MKCLIKLPFAVLALCLAIPATRAQEAGTPPPPPPPPKGEHAEHQKSPHGDGLRYLTEKLTLTVEQQAKIKPILDERKKAMEALRADSTLDKDAKWAKTAEIFKSHQAQIRALLTPEQQKIFDELRPMRGPGGPGNHGPGGPGEPPKPPQE